MIRRTCFSVAVALTLLALSDLTAGRAQADFISISFAFGLGPTIDVDAYANPGSTTYSVGPAGLGVINSLMDAYDTGYHFASLSGSSNWSGSSTQGVLSLEVQTTSGPGNGGPLTITETETGFLSPSSTTGGGTLTSSATTSNNQLPSGLSTALSQFNATPTPLYSVSSTGTSASIELGPPLLTPYTLTNVLELKPAVTIFGPGQFNVTATVTSSAAPAPTPEPTSLVLALIGGVTLAGARMARRRKAA